ncbi:MAG: hypothetical protein AAB385_00925, partial [Planctomycetota bacterium]
LLSFREFITFRGFDTAGKQITITRLPRDDYWYCVCASLAPDIGASYTPGPGPPREDWTRVEVYRVAPPPSSYVGQTDAARYSQKPEDKYFADFCQVVTGHEKGNLGIRYELVHSDPRGIVSSK